MNGAKILENGNTSSKRFMWHTVDFRSDLPRGWQESLLVFANDHSQERIITPASVTSRERSAVTAMPVHFIGGTAVGRGLPWLRDLYYGAFREVAQLACSEPVSPAREVHIGLNMHIQLGDAERYECHVDSSPLSVLLYVTDHPVGRGGDLVISNRGDVRGRQEVDADATRIHPVAGQLVVFDGRHHTHYVAPLKDPDGVRVAVVMPYYTPSCSEGLRPADLDHHLGLD